MEFNGHLNDFYQSQVKTDFTNLSALSSTMKSIENILNAVKSRDKRFRLKNGPVGCLGCHVPSLKFSECDVLFPVEVECQAMETEFPEYVKLKPEGDSADIWRDCIDSGGNLDPEQFSCKFNNLLEESINSLDFASPVTLIGKGSTASTIQFTDPYKGASVDVVLTVRCKQQNDVLKYDPFSGTMHQCYWPDRKTKEAIKKRGLELVASSHGQKHGLWRLSFSFAETSLVDNARREFKTFGKVFTILKALRILHLIPRERKELISKFKSYHCKVIMLHEALTFPDKSFWAENRLGERFISVLERLKATIKDNNLPHFYLPEINLFYNNSPSFVLEHELLSGEPVTFLERVKKDDDEDKQFNYFY